MPNRCGLNYRFILTPGARLKAVDAQAADLGRTIRVRVCRHRRVLAFAEYRRVLAFAE
jgi:hypothetical protein